MGIFGGHVVIVLGDNFNAQVYHELRDCLIEAGEPVVVAALKSDMELIDSSGNELVRPNIGVENIPDFNFDAIVLSDGTVSDDLRDSKEFHDVIRHAHTIGMIIGTIGLSVRYLIDAGVAASHFLTGSPEVRYELETHGAFYQNEPVWVDGNLISGRLLEDIPVFCKELVNQISLRPAA
ncbi:MAG TPA: DJ-1/PfpI family protein [Anaerolineae bacterium]|jgi:protease I|nr:DJ-1/PfpI family protein [Anaerolineae bacterium]